MSNTFFQDLEQKKKFSCCSCQTLAISLAVLLLAGIIGVWWLVKAIRQPVAPVQKITPAAISPADFWQTKFDQLLSDWQTALATNQPAPIMEVVLTQEELTALIRQGTAKIKKKTLDNPTAAITPDKVELYGTLLEPVKIAAVVDIVPYIEPSTRELKFHLTALRAGKISLPKKWLKNLEEQQGELLGNDLNAALTGSEELKLTDIVLQDGKIVLKVTPPENP